MVNSSEQVTTCSFWRKQQIARSFGVPVGIAAEDCMAKRKQIEPKPTEYRGTLYDSRLEARWAILLDNCPNVLHFRYHPRTYELQNGWKYTPDFEVTCYNNRSRRLSIYFEIKPIKPLLEYVYDQLKFCHQFQFDLIIVWGSLYGDGTIESTFLSQSADKPIPVSIDEILADVYPAFKIASSYRFDI